MAQLQNVVLGVFVRVCWLLLWLLLAGAIYITGHNPNFGFRLCGRVSMYDWPGQIVWYRGTDDNVELVQGVTTIGLLPGTIIGQADKEWFLIHVPDNPIDASPIVTKYASRESLEQAFGKRISEFQLYRDYPYKLMRYHDDMVRWLWVIAVLFVVSMVGFLRTGRFAYRVGCLFVHMVMGDRGTHSLESSQSQ